MKPAGIILAAGESSRMGRDKALLPFRDTTFLDHILSGFLPRLEPVIVVLGCHAEAIRRSIREPVRETTGGSASRSEAVEVERSDTAPAERQGVRVVVNPDYKRGMLSSLQTGIAALPATAEAAMFTLVDHPDVRAETLDKLLAVYRETGARLVIPRMGEQRGHPVIAARSVLEEIARLSPDASPKDVIRAHREETVLVEVEDPGILRDIDTPGEYERLVGGATEV